MKEIDNIFFLEVKSIKVDPIYVNRISITGNGITKNNTILNYIQIEPGDLYNQNVIDFSKNKINRLKFINNVTVEESINDNQADINYDIDVTSNQRVGKHIDIGTGATAAITSNTASKETRLYIEQSWTDPGVTYKPIEIKLTNDSGDGKMIDMLKADGTSVFSVDKQGNVAIQPGSSYGISDRAFNTFLTVASASNTGNQEISIQTLIPATTVTVPSYVGSSASTNLNYSYGFRTSTDLGSYRFYGAPADLDNFNTRSMLVFINGVLQTPYVNFYFDGTRLYFNTQPLLGSKIEVRCLAN